MNRKRTLVCTSMLFVSYLLVNSNIDLPVSTGLHAALATDVGQHVREIGDVHDDSRATIVRVDNGSISVLLSQASGLFATPILGIRGHFGYAQSAGSWRVNQHVRKVADVNGDGRADIVGFGDGSVSVALGQPNGSFATPTLGIRGHFARDDGWRVDQHVREVADVNGDGRADIVGFGDASVSVALVH